MLTVVEPKQVGGSIFADNAGSRDSGRARVGFSVTNRSLTGRRDALSVSGVMSEGSRAGYLSYTTPIGSAGGTLEVSAGANQVHNVRGPWHGIADIRSYAQSFTARWSYPWYAGPKGRQGYFIEYAYRRNRTKVDGVDTTNNRTHSVTGGVEFLTYWNHALLYHSWSVAYTSKDDHVFDEKSYYMLYKLYALYQNIDPRNGRTLSARINAGWGSSDTDSSDMMSIGGSSSVRGYDKDIISADGGASINLEYSIPVSRDRKWQVFGFVDYGFLWDDDTVVGQFRVRHYLCESLRTGAGHIGYFIAKPFRGKGYGTEGLRLVLEEARHIVPEEEFYLRVNRDNPASLRVMMKNGGRIAAEDETKYYVRIPNPGKG